MVLSHGITEYNKDFPKLLKTHKIHPNTIACVNIKAGFEGKVRDSPGITLQLP